MRPNENTDAAELLAHARRGDAGAFAELVRRHKREMLAFAARFCRSPHEADDLGQEIFLKAYRCLDRFRGKCSFRTWLYRVASSVCTDYLRRQQRKPETQPAEPDHCSHCEAAARDRRILVQSMLTTLKPLDRIVVTMLYMEGWSVQEAAERCGISSVNVRVRAYRAKAKLQQFLEKEDA